MKTTPLVKSALATLLLMQSVGPLSAKDAKSFDLPACTELGSDQSASSDAQDTLPTINLPAAKPPAAATKSAVDQARSVSTFAIPMTPSSRELKDSAQLTTDAECEQVKDLWAATIERSPDISFVLERLQPNSDEKHNGAQAARLIGGLLSGIAGIGSYAAPSGLPRIGAGAGNVLLDRMLGTQDKASLKQLQVSKEQLIFSYSIVRQTADRLVDSYRQYRKAQNTLSRAMQDLSDARSLAQVIDERSKAQQFLIDMNIRSARRDAENAEQDLHMSEQQLADLAGEEAVERLNDQVALEQTQLQRLVGGSDVLAQPLKPHQQQTATSPTTEQASQP